MKANHTTKELKKHLSLSDQVERLQQRGLIINDIEEAKQLLSRVNYYRLSGYLHHFRKKGEDRYADNVSLETIKEIYDFDRKFTRILMYALEDIEETLKTRVSYCLTSAHPEDPLIYKDPALYRDIDEYRKFINKIERLVWDNKNLPFVKHHMQHYNKQLPMWVLVELLTMGNLQALFKNLLGPYQKQLAASYNTSAPILANWIQELTYTRNHLAHYMRIYALNFGRTPAKCNNHSLPVQTTNYIFDRICVIFFMYSDPYEWNTYILPEIENLLSSHSNVIDIKLLGFPENWKELLTHPTGSETK